MSHVWPHGIDGDVRAKSKGLWIRTPRFNIRTSNDSNVYRNQILNKSNPSWIPGQGRSVGDELEKRQLAIGQSEIPES